MRRKVYKCTRDEAKKVGWWQKLKTELYDAKVSYTRVAIQWSFGITTRPLYEREADTYFLNFVLWMRPYIGLVALLLICL